MDFNGRTGEVSDLQETNGTNDAPFDSDTQEKYDALMEDDKIYKETPEEVSGDNSEKINDKYDALFKDGDFFKSGIPETAPTTTYSTYIGETISEMTLSDMDVSAASDESAEGVETDGVEDDVKTDDNGNEYMRNGELLPNNEYTINGTTYRTDDRGRIISVDSNPAYTEDGIRNSKAQTDAGGDERHADDQGGHLIARILGGSEGAENLVAMRGTINQGDYKKMENEIAAACKEGKDVSMHIEINYDGDSERPSTIHAEYTIDGKTTTIEFDNKENSTELLEGLEDKINEDDYDNLCNEIEDMKEDGCDVSITSVKTKLDENGNAEKVIVGIRNETTGEKTYKPYDPKEG